jgi:hypothetical protein
MKKIFLFLAVVLLATSMYAQKLKDAQVPAVVKSGFQKQYPNTKGTWERENGNYEMTFKKEGSDVSVLINGNGTIVETETDIAVSQLPATASNYIKKHYKGQQVKEAAKIVKANGEVSFEAELKGKDILFDANGKFLREVKHGKDGDKEDND